MSGGFEKLMLPQKQGFEEKPPFLGEALKK